ncbi:MAG: hypothetical protein MJZ25_03715 [Fibrobacter sp.]|nr:hypothetical protein [Fibrobacter sp.]
MDQEKQTLNYLETHAEELSKIISNGVKIAMDDHRAKIAEYDRSKAVLEQQMQAMRDNSADEPLELSDSLNPNNSSVITDTIARFIPSLGTVFETSLRGLRTVSSDAGNTHATEKLQQSAGATSNAVKSSATGKDSGVVSELRDIAKKSSAANTGSNDPQKALAQTKREQNRIDDLVHRYEVVDPAYNQMKALGIAGTTGDGIKIRGLGGIMSQQSGIGSLLSSLLKLAVGGAAFGIGALTVRVSQAAEFIKDVASVVKGIASSIKSNFTKLTNLIKSNFKSFDAAPKAPPKPKPKPAAKPSGGGGIFGKIKAFANSIGSRLMRGFESAKNAIKPVTDMISRGVKSFTSAIGKLFESFTTGASKLASFARAGFKLGAGVMKALPFVKAGIGIYDGINHAIKTGNVTDGLTMAAGTTADALLDMVLVNQVGGLIEGLQEGKGGKQLLKKVLDPTEGGKKISYGMGAVANIQNMVGNGTEFTRRMAKASKYDMKASDVGLKQTSGNGLGVLGATYDLAATDAQKVIETVKNESTVRTAETSPSAESSSNTGVAEVKPNVKLGAGSVNIRLSESQIGLKTYNQGRSAEHGDLATLTIPNIDQNNNLSGSSAFKLPKEFAETMAEGMKNALTSDDYRQMLIDIQKHTVDNLYGVGG